jgi:hypothetical protein
VLPRDLLPDGSPEDQFAPRPISLEEAFSRQNDRIGYLRSTGLPWAEAVYQLRDLLVGIEDDEFWDGIPATERSRLPKLTEEEAERARQRWAEEGWLGYPCRAIRGPSGQPVFRPTADNLSHAYRIIMRLAARRGLSWRTKRISKLPGPPDGFDRHGHQGEPAAVLNGAGP